MWKKIIKDYWWEFSLIKIKELWKSGQASWVVGFIIYGVYTCNRMGIQKGMVSYGFGILPFFFQLLSGQLHSIKMPKILRHHQNVWWRSCPRRHTPSLFCLTIFYLVWMLGARVSTKWCLHPCG